jgi:ubiquinone biosynthesis protein
VLDDNRVAFVDFGIFGRLTPYDREILGAQIEQLAVGNIDESLRFYSKQLTITEESDARAFRAEARAVLQEWYDLSVRDDSPVAARHLGKYIGQMIDISRRYRLLYDMSFLLYWRALNALDSTALRMSPTFDLMAELRAFFEEVRPGFLERLAEIARDQRRLSVARRVKQQLPERVAAMVDGAASGRSETTLLSGERAERRRARNHETRWLGAAAAALSLLVLSDAHGHGTVAAALALGAGAAICLLAVARLRPR